MKICSAQIQSIKGDIESNIQKHVACINNAVRNAVNLIFFPELSILGYEPTFVKELAISETDHRLDVFQNLADSTNLIICIGAPTRQSAGICISMIIFQPNTPRTVYSKQILHADEYPYFISGKEQIFFSYEDHKIAPAICFESLQNEHAANASAHGANIYLASVAKSAKGVEKANLHYTQIAKNLNLIVLMANAIGPSDDFMGAGNSAVWNEYGEKLLQLDDTTEAIIIYDTETQQFSTHLI